MYQRKYIPVWGIIDDDAFIDPYECQERPLANQLPSVPCNRSSNHQKDHANSYDRTAVYGVEAGQFHGLERKKSTTGKTGKATNNAQIKGDTTTSFQSPRKENPSA